MATVAVLTYNDYLKLIFETYNERYEGTYPNLVYKADIRARFEGKFSIQASNTLRFGELSQTYYMRYPQWSGVTQWYELGTIAENMGCNRKREFSYGCSVSGWPNLSGTANVTTPVIGLPSFETSIDTDGITQTSIPIKWKITDNPYNLYALRIYSVDRTKFVANSLNGSKGTFVDSGLTQNTEYEYHVESWMADLSGAYLDQEVLEARTLENYPAITVQSVDVVLSPQSNGTDTITFTAHTSDDAHVSQTVWQISGGPERTQSGLKYTETGMAQNSELTATVYTKDTLGRSSAKYQFKFTTTFTQREVYVFDGSQWRRGYSYDVKDREFKLCELWVHNGVTWKRAPAYQ